MAKDTNGRRWYVIGPLLALIGTVFGAGGITMAFRKDIASTVKVNDTQQVQIDAVRKDQENLKFQTGQDITRLNTKVDAIMLTLDEIKKDVKAIPIW